MKTTKQLIEEYINSPIIVGDYVSIKGLGIQNKEGWGNSVHVVKVEGETVFYKHYDKIESTHISNCQKDPIFIGKDPFVEKSWNSQLRMVNLSLQSILYKVGFDKEEKYKINGVTIPSVCFTPIVTNSKGEEVQYQRGFVWELKDKQLLIESIYNYIDIGKIIVRLRSWEYIEKRFNEGKFENTAFVDVVDGKQRLNAILGFVNNEFPDLHGNYWDDLSERAKRRFEDFLQVAYGEIGETATDEDVLNVFLNINFTGVQMSQEHLDYVKSINLK